MRIRVSVAATVFAAVAVLVTGCGGSGGSGAETVGGSPAGSAASAPAAAGSTPDGAGTAPAPGTASAPALPTGTAVSGSAADAKFCDSATQMSKLDTSAETGSPAEIARAMQALEAVAKAAPPQIRSATEKIVAIAEQAAKNGKDADITDFGPDGQQALGELMKYFMQHCPGVLGGG